MQKWEYLQVVVLYIEGSGTQVVASKDQPHLKTDETEYLDSLGAKGWEMARTTGRDVRGNLHLIYHFKRPIQ